MRQQVFVSTTQMWQPHEDDAQHFYLAFYERDHKVETANIRAHSIEEAWNEAQQRLDLTESEEDTLTILGPS